MDIGPRIKLARAKAQMSLRELAEKVGVTPMAISKFERGEVSPRQSTLIRLAQALSVNPEYFFREVTVETLAPAYRKQSKLNQKAQDAVEATIIETMERYLAVEEVLPDEGPSPGDLPHYRVDSADGAEAVAEKVRKAWDLGFDPIEGLSARLEEHGVRVISVEGPDGFDGYSCFANGELPVIAFNKQVPADRQRFSLAHELGHLVMETSSEVDEELAAHRFAAAFLVPAKTAYSALGRRRSNLSFDELIFLKEQYGMSLQAWIRRAADLSIIDQHTYGMLYRRLSTRGWRVTEPGKVHEEEPTRLQMLVYRALAENLISPAYAATLLRKSSSGHPTVRHAALEEPSATLVREYEEDAELTASAGADLEDYDG